MTDKSSNNKLQLHAVFVQANPIAGYRYLDLSGIVLNRIADLYSGYTIDTEGCILIKPKDLKDPYSIRFSAQRIWLHYALIESLKYVEDTASQWIESISKDIEVTRFSRLGVRSEFFTPCTDIVKSTTILSRKVSSSVFQSMIAEVEDPADAAIEFTIRIPIKQFIASIRVTTVRIIRKPTESTKSIDYPSDGLIFDVDIYRRRKPPEGLSKAEIKGFIKSASDHTSELLEKVGYSLLEE